MNPDDKIDLSSVNKPKKQFKFPKLKNPFKKSTAGPGRDEFGQFTSGSGGLLNTKHFNWKRVAPLVAVVTLVGGFLVFKSFAGTYTACGTAEGAYKYSEECVTNSSEASIVRLYFGIFNRAPDKSGLKYWGDRLNAKKSSLLEVARQFMGSSEFKNKYGPLSNEAFVKAMYPQVFGRAPDAGGLQFWTNRLNTKKATREAMMTNFTESSEMKRTFMFQVAESLGIDIGQFATKVADIKRASVTCLTATEVKDGKTYCKGQGNYKNIALKVRVDGLISQPGEYFIQYSIKVPGSSYIQTTTVAPGGAIFATDNELTLGSVVSDSYVGRSTVNRRPIPGTSRVEAGEQVMLISGSPYDQVIHIDMSSIKIYKPSLLEPFQFAQDYPDESRRKLRQTNDCGPLILGSTRVGCKDPFYQVEGSASTQKPDWVHTSQRTYKGKVSFYIDTWRGVSDKNLETRLKVKLKNAKTDELIKGYSVYRTDYVSEQDKRIVYTRDPVNRDLVYPLGTGMPAFTVEAQLASTTQLKLEVSSVGPMPTLFNDSMFKPFWDSDEYLSSGYKKFEE